MRFPRWDGNGEKKNGAEFASHLDIGGARPDGTWRNT